MSANESLMDGGPPRPDGCSSAWRPGRRPGSRGTTGRDPTRRAGSALALRPRPEQIEVSNTWRCLASTRSGGVDGDDGWDGWGDRERVSEPRMERNIHEHGLAELRGRVPPEPGAQVAWALGRRAPASPGDVLGGQGPLAEDLAVLRRREGLGRRAHLVPLVCSSKYYSLVTPATQHHDPPPLSASMLRSSSSSVSRKCDSWFAWEGRVRTRPAVRICVVYSPCHPPGAQHPRIRGSYSPARHARVDSPPPPPPPPTARSPGCTVSADNSSCECESTCETTGERDASRTAYPRRVAMRTATRTGPRARRCRTPGRH
ncbi:hypothetical protein GGR56DRAFT_431871 [Xylariaceae sp. FL0804]|nr:hypothetical protein GGR56DRAFT_431871 [Xylariaceae sp. FL0804]